MPSETHQHSGTVSVHEVLRLLASIVDVDPVHAASIPLPLFDLDDDLAIVRLWESVVEEFGERGVGELEFDHPLPSTLGQLASVFYAAMS